MTLAKPEVLLAHSYFMNYDPKQVQKMRPYPPLATLITASVLREKGYGVALFDAMLSPGVEEFVELVRDLRPSIVVIHEDNFNFLTKMCTTRMRDAAVSMINESRRLGAFVVAHGSDAIDVPHLFLEAGAHAVMLGEAERTLPEVLHAHRNGGCLDAVRGLVIPAQGATSTTAETVRRTPNRPIADEFASLPLPAWDLVDANAYRRAWTEAHGRFSWNMVTTRGCPFKCNWCAKPLFGQRYEQRRAEDVAAEIAYLKSEIEPDHIWFGDDIFGLSPRWIENFADALDSQGVSIPFTIQSRVDLMTDSACEALARAGCEEAWIGVESGSQEILDAMDKGTTVEKIRLGTRRLRRHGVKASWFLQLGYPGEDWPQILLTRDLVREETPDDIGVSVSYPLPGTIFHDMVRQELTDKTNWVDSDELAMLFEGSFTTGLYRLVRDLLHEEAVVAIGSDAVKLKAEQAELDRRWNELEADLARYRSASPTDLRRAVGT